ncbi:helix-turn-helix domain-containing protein [Sediminitomix flava]|uniref:AraC-like DNA-binding protein n=1 Tax=Sediminitomix flava TaxID=379075 RepID=A0A315ZBN9_SEDFL|nr:helix-turn-helix domain-containing protein [Sediminitomix flava]PWJ42722.1 AraC-like DNA-binding protein [Sediminitomix flava]
MREFLLHIGIVQCFFGAVVIFNKDRKRLSDYLLAAWLILAGVEGLVEYLYTKDLSSPVSIFLPLCSGPLLLLYTRNLIAIKQAWKKYDWLHFLPALIIFLIGFYLKDDLVMDEGKFFRVDDYLWFRLLVLVSYITSFFVYAVIVIILVINHNAKIRDSFSYSDGSVTLSWLRIILFSYLTINIIPVVWGFGAYFLSLNSRDMLLSPGVISNIGLVIFAFSITYYGAKQKALYHSDLYESEDDVEAEEKEEEEKKDVAKYERSGLKADDLKVYENKLIQYMEAQKPYLNSELNIQDLAEHLGISRHYLTQLLNTVIDKNFYTFVNEYRIDEVKKKLIDPSNSHLTILAIAFDCGFNSKSTFNSLFKQNTGKTPSVYRKEMSAAAS